MLRLVSRQKVALIRDDAAARSLLRQLGLDRLVRESVDAAELERWFRRVASEGEVPEKLRPLLRCREEYRVTLT